MKTIVFQGDSITDAGRNRNNDNERGIGYPTLVAAELGYKYPGEYVFINEGVSGNRIVDLYARIKRDIIHRRPDYLTILIGINDVWHELNERNGVDNKKFFKVYCDLIEEIKAVLPDIKIFILEPFVLRASATSKNWAVFRRETEMRAASAKAVAEKYDLTFIPLQEKFDEAEKKAEASYWLLDGVHPSAAGHELIAREVTAALEKSF
ncbi:MAG: lysophospholipase [Ruminococcaceae bacterium]|nr:lysophospholipase [Oscillospiraceae bacterium]MBR3595912.1 SGNH/GDSL hydrolase family protein [Clostridia bacterium]